MSQENQISVALDASKLASIKEKLSGLRTDLSETLVTNLTNEERQNMLKMGDKTLAFVDKALEFAQLSPAFKPAYLNLEEAKKDFELAKNLSDILKDITTLQRGLEDTMMVAGGEAYDASLIFYASVKGASRTNEPGAQAVYEELSKRFPRRSKKSASDNHTIA